MPPRRRSGDGCDGKAPEPGAKVDAKPPRSRRLIDESHREQVARTHLDWSGRHCGAIVQLQPKRPPGRADRKAAAYASEIVRLRAEGYTYEAIREALTGVGIELSESALRREVRRQQQRVMRAAPCSRPPSPVPDAPSLPVTQALATGPPPSTGSSGREIAEAFFKAHPSNPLFPTKESS